MRVVANWHEASDGRGITELQRCRKNYKMLEYLVADWMPWYGQEPDFSLVDINRFAYFCINTQTKLMDCEKNLHKMFQC